MIFNMLSYNIIQILFNVLDEDNVRSTNDDLRMTKFLKIRTSPIRSGIKSKIVH